MSSLRLSFACIVALLISGNPSWGDSSAKPFIAPIFTDNMVLQRGQPDPIWGWTSPGTAVTVTLDTHTVKAVADSTGYWIAKLPSLPAGGPHTITVAGPQTVTFQNVAEGDVWLCSGQSNMEFGIGMTDNSAQEIAAANYPDIRINLQPHQVATLPRITNGGSWQVCTPQTIVQGGWNGFTAVGYFFGRDLYNNLKIPIGLIESDWGGTPAEAWTSADALRQKLPEFDDTLSRISSTDQSYDYLLSDSTATEASLPPLTVNQDTPSTLFNGMVSPIVPFGIKGVIWYQGEANANRGTQYRTLLPTLIGDWRARWNEGPFPFYIVQLANLGQPPAQPTDDGWANLRDAQLYTSLTVPNTGLAVTDDIGNPTNIHPTNKQEVGRRLSLVALAKTYGVAGEYSGPIYKSDKIVGSTIVVTFDHVGSGLTAKGGGPLTGFEIAGSDNKFVWADAKIDGSTVVVSSPSITAPTNVRFAWAENPVFNLYNADGLPASPFRTDVPPVVVDPVLPADAGPDLALGATAVSSDPNTHGWDSGLTDGSWSAGQGTTYASNDEDQFPKTVTIDLRNPAKIGLVEIGVPPFGSTKTVAVSLSVDGNTFTNVGSYVFSLNNEERHLFSFTPILARYVRLTYPDHYADGVSYSPTFVFTTELAAYAPGTPAPPKEKQFNPGPNFALNATYVSSDPNPSGWSGGLTDGSWLAGQGTTWASGMTPTFPKTVTIDMTKSPVVGVIAIGVPPFGSTKTIDVSVSADGASYSDIGSYVFTLGKEERHVFKFAGVKTRYIKLTYPDHYDQQAGYDPNYVFTTEVEAYAPFAGKP